MGLIDWKINLPKRIATLGAITRQKAELNWRGVLSRPATLHDYLWNSRVNKIESAGGGDPNVVWIAW